MLAGVGRNKTLSRTILVFFGCLAVVFGSINTSFAASAATLEAKLLDDQTIAVQGSGFLASQPFRVQYAFGPDVVTRSGTSDVNGAFSVTEPVPAGFSGRVVIRAFMKRNAPSTPSSVPTSSAPTTAPAPTTTPAPSPAPSGTAALRVSDNGRYLVSADGKPFVWFADTAWSLLVLSTREDAITYLDNRQKQGFNVIQTVATMAPETTPLQPNAYKQQPWDGVFGTPNSAYFDHVDFVVQEAEKRGMYIALLPVWTSLIQNGGFDMNGAEAYGKFLGQRYKNNKIIWMLGGDSNNPQPEMTRLIAKGIATGVTGSEDYSKVLMTYHPAGGTSSSNTFHSDQWLDFNMAQSGHCNGKSYELTSGDWNKSPTKPALDGESYYEDHPLCWDASRGYSTDQQVRSGLYTGVFAGGFGFTYGNQSIWQMYQQGREPHNAPRKTWQEALTSPVGTQAQYLRYLLESRPVLTRIPDQGLLASDQGDGWSRVQATRDSNGSYLMVYVAPGKSADVKLDVLSGDSAKAWWYDPRTGQSQDAGTLASSGTKSFTPPSADDWVLVVDDVASSYGAPGK